MLWPTVRNVLVSRVVAAILGAVAALAGVQVVGQDDPPAPEPVPCVSK